MKVCDEQDIQKLLVDAPYFKSKENFCLGKTLKEAGVIIQMIAKEREQEEQYDNDRVSGMAIERVQEDSPATK